MANENTEVQTNNELTNDEIAQERRNARAIIAGKDPEPVQEQPQTPAVEETAEAAEEVTKQERKRDEKGRFAPAAEAAAGNSEATPKDEPVDPLADIPDELRGKIESLLQAERDRAKKLEDRIKSDDGRVNAYQRKYEEIGRKLSEVEKSLAATSSTPLKTLKESANNPRIKEALEADPALVDFMDEVFAEKARELEERFNQRLRTATAPLYESQHLEAQDNFTRTLDSQYSNWREAVYAHDESGRIVADKNGVPVFSEGWAHYIRSQPPSIQQAITNVSTPQEAIWALDNYVEWGKRNSVFDEPQQQQPAAPAIQNADAIQKKRQEDLKRVNPARASQVPLATAPQNLDDESTIERLRRAAREAIKKGDPSIFTR